MENVIIEKSDLLHEVIYEISENAQDIKFPIQRIVKFLVEEGYGINHSETTKTAYVLYRENKKAVVTDNFVSFETLNQADRERYKQNLYTYVISRSKIYFQSAKQNVKAAKINLIQNQRRTCVSNMYYALHNSFASMIEFYKSETLINKQLLEEESYSDDETKLEHFVPKALSVYVENIDDILSTEKEEYITNTKMNVGRLKSHENPFAWVYPLFSHIIEEGEEDEVVEMVNSMADALQKINLDNFGVDSTSRRSNFEKQLKENLMKIREVSRTEGMETKKILFLNVAAFFAYAYMLRQSADYDSLFEVKVPHKDIINWTIITSNFLNLVSTYIKENNAQSTDRIQKLDAASSTEILRIFETDSNSTIMTMTGIIIDKEFNLVKMVRKLYSQKGYKMINQRGKIVELNQNTEVISMCRILFGTPLECFISFSNQGLFRIDIALRAENEVTNFSKGINQFYLEQLIQQDVIEKGLLTVVSKNATIVRGIPTTLQHNSLNYLDLVLGIHESTRRSIQFSIVDHLSKSSQELSSNQLTINCMFTMSGNKREILFRIRRLFGEHSFGDKYISALKERKIKRFLYICFCPYGIPHATEVETEVVTFVKDKFPELDFKFELVQLSELEVRQLIEKDNSSLDLIINNLIEKHQTPENLERSEMISVDDEDIDPEISDVDIEAIEESIDKVETLQS